LIRTEFDDELNLLELIPCGGKTGILACSNCSAVYGTGDTKRIDDILEKIKGHCEVVFTTSIDSPCDLRLLNYVLPTIEGFESVEFIIVLSCVAGKKSIGHVLKKKKLKIEIINPVKTEDFSIIKSKNHSVKACVFCDECSFPDLNDFCPVASCPAYKKDGPCQNRTSNKCVMNSEIDCVWL